MDLRWQPFAPNSKRDMKVILHPRAEIFDIAQGTSIDGIDLSPFVVDGKQSINETSVRLRWNYQLFGTYHLQQVTTAGTSGPQPGPVWFHNGNLTADGTVVWADRGDGKWQALHVYLLGDVIIDPGEHLQKVTTPGTSAAQPPPSMLPTPTPWSVNGSTTHDGSVVWTDQGLVAGWKPGTAYALGAIVTDTTLQPAPFHLLEVQLLQNNIFTTIWIGVVDQISSVTLSRGERELQLIARARNNLNIWKQTPRVTRLYSQLTNYATIAFDIAQATGLYPQEILLPTTALVTAHSNTQMAALSSWEMLTTLFLPLGWTPFIDGLGRLKVANRDIRNRPADLILTDAQVLKVVANRVKPPTTRVRVLWLDPVLKKSVQTGRKLADVVMTGGFFQPFNFKIVQFSEDNTQRAEKTYLRIMQHAGGIPKVGIPIVVESWTQIDEVHGILTLFSVLGTIDIVAMIVLLDVFGFNATALSDIGKWHLLVLILLIMCSMGTGVYEIWGNPYNWVHARNITEAFDQNSPGWIDNPQDIESDFIVNEGHAQTVAIRELIYQAKSANGWSVQIVDNPVLEYGDIIEFADGSRVFVEDCSRSLARGSENVLEVRGFQV